jgi:hypothetical protein
VATWEPHQATVLEAIRELGLEHHIIFNKGAVMVLPPGINKAAGLEAHPHHEEPTRFPGIGVHHSPEQKNEHLTQFSFC